MNKTEADRANKFSRVIQGGGPGGCNTPNGCKTFCSDVSNLDACLKWADQNNFEDEHFKEAQKIQSYLASGGKMPGGCTSKEFCMTYCGDFSHAEECFNFAKTSGLTQESSSDIPRPGEVRRPGDRIPNEEQFKKLAELTARGETPGGCKSKEACEAYCEEGGHFEECLAFGEKVGFVKSDEAKKFRELGGKGPGGCNSPRACEAYCNDPSHQEDCFKFGEEHGLIPPGELERAKEGFVHLKAGIEQAPPEVAECLKTTVGPNIIEDIQSGKLTPGPAIGERVRGCFERFGARHNPQEILRGAPPQVISCLNEKFGDKFGNIQSGKSELTPEIGDTFRVCFEQMQFRKGGPGQGGGPSPQALQGFLRSAPPTVALCLKDKLGDEYERLASGGAPSSPDIAEKIRGCFEQFRPEGGHMEGRPGMDGGFPIPGGSAPPGLKGLLENAPPNVADCLKQSIGVEVFARLQAGEQPSGDVGEKLRACFGGQPPTASPPGGTMPVPMPPTGTRFPEVVSLCLKQHLSEDQVRVLQSGSQPSAEAEAAIRGCFSELQSPGGTLPPLQPIFEQPQEMFTQPSSGIYEDPSTRCMNAGGKWTGSICEFLTQPSPPPSSFREFAPSLLGTILGPVLKLFSR